ncbi:ATP-binding protein [Corynebacterium belfantii]|uniref:ATP-binding protein n=1 Tax=Corynebacterium belfantii TaxID=2014537 RepID=UPI0018D3087A|nr:ATP-binding protein [Corynebacterium belfantii]MBG9320485.1 ATP-binding protein [Corynebacterium belfantii]
MEQSSDKKIAVYMATLQMRLSRLLADGRYDFMTRVESHEAPLGSYLRLLMGADPTKGNQNSDWPASDLYSSQSSTHTDGPSVTIFDLSMVASDVLENVTALLGRILFDFAVRSNPRAEHPVLLVLEEAHRFIPARTDAFGAGSRSTAVFERIAKEGRRFGLSLLLASQRPSELSETVIAQCGTVIAHRLTHKADQSLLRHATAFSSYALLEQLPGLAQQHALVTGVSTGVPAAVRMRDVPDAPRSNDPDFLKAWCDEIRLKRLPQHIEQVAQSWIGDSTKLQ